MKLGAPVRSLVNDLRAFCDSIPAVKFADTFVSLCGVMLVFRHNLYRIRNGSKDIYGLSGTEGKCVDLRGLPSSSGFAKDIMSSGRISGTPPTRVDTTYRPAQAASTMEMPKASVREVLTKMVPRVRTYGRFDSWFSEQDGRTYTPDIAWVYRSKQLDPILQKILFAHLKKINQFGAITAFDKWGQ